MSRIGKRAVSVPSGITANVEGQTVKVKGPKGALSAVLPDEVSVKLDGGQIKVDPRSVYRKHKLSRIALRDLGSKGMIPGMVKSSW